MNLVYLAYSDSVRAHPHTANKPLSAVKLLNKTAIEHNLAAAANVCDNLIIVTGFCSKIIRRLLGESFLGKEITYVEVDCQATAASVMNACAEYCRNGFILLDERCIYSPANLQALAKAASGKILCQDGSYGAFAFTQEHADGILTDGLDAIIENLPEIELTDYCLPFVYPWHILEANVFLLRRFDGFGNFGTIEQGATVKGDVYIGKGSVVKEYCYVEGPAFIDAGSTIGPFAYIRPDTVIGKNVQLGRMEVYDSVIMDGFTSKHNSYAGHSVIGSKGNFGAGTITSDYRHDGANHKTLINGEKVDTLRRKLGAFIGDNVNTGIGTLIYPGRKIYPGATTLPGEIVKADKTNP